ncbi:MAG: hypothetical protein P1U36_05330 [Legionellaceae bacterium]|nr:hypothetical protein [Legionellaceae bacterium]
MEAFVVKQFFNCLSDALSSEHPGVFFFSEELQDKLSEIVPEPASGTPEHDISYLVYRLKQHALGVPVPIDGKIGNKLETLLPHACDLLAERWEVIKNTSEDYTRCSVAQNQLALTFVKQLANFSLRLSAYAPELKSANQRWMKVFSTDGVKTEFNIYALLIPTLTQRFDPVSKDIISNSDLHRLILSDDGMSLFSLKNSQDSFDRGEGFFNLDVFPSRFFTLSEKKRITDKPEELQPLAARYWRETDYIVTLSNPTPALESTTRNVILRMIQRAEAVESNPEFSFEAFKEKYYINNQPLTEQDIQYLCDDHEARYRDDYRIDSQLRASTNAHDDIDEASRFELDVERSKISFRAQLDTSGRAQSDQVLNFLALKTCQTEIAWITAQMLGYCHQLEKSDSYEYRRLMNQVLYDGKTQPKTFSYLIKYVRSGFNCSSVTLLSELARLFKPQQQHSIPTTRPQNRTESRAIPMASSARPKGAGILSYFYSSSTEPNSVEPTSVANKMAYSPERDSGFI